MSVSIVLTTYNGEKYIVEQLDSIRKQTYTPDEVLIFDDYSKDSTVKIIKEYIDEHELKWRLIINNYNLGWKENFRLAISEASGDFIFLSDQDDIWRNDKVEIMIDVMNKQPEIGLLASDYNVLYSSDKAIKIHHNSNNTNEINKIKVSYNLMKIWRPGCTYCFRSSLYNRIEQFWNRNFPHDLWLWSTSILLGELFLIDSPLVNFRRHENNSSSDYSKNRKKRYMELLESIDLFRALKYLMEEEQSQESFSIEVVNGNIEFLKLRKKMYENRDIFCHIKLLLSYSKYYITFNSIWGDLLLAVFSSDDKEWKF